MSTIRIKRLLQQVVFTLMFIMALSSNSTSRADEATAVPVQEDQQVTVSSPVVTQVESNQTLLQGWVNSSGGWTYYKNGMPLSNGWYWVATQAGEKDAYVWKYFNQSGINIDSIYVANGNSWLSKAGPTAYFRGWYLDPVTSKYYYFRPSTGSAVNNWQFINGYWYFFKDNLMLENGWYWLPINNGQNFAWKYIVKDGQNINQFYQESGKRWLSPAGPYDYYKGWWTDPVNGLRYYFRTTSGSQVTGWQWIDDTWHYFRSSGSQATGFQYINGQWYYLNQNTGLVTGWQQINGYWYYFRSSGTMATGLQYLDYRWELFDKDGKLVNWMMYNNISWAGQPNNYYCGPAAGYMILNKLGAYTSAEGYSLTINNLAKFMSTDYYGYTSFHDRWFEKGINRWLGRNQYTTVHTPSYEMVRKEILRSFQTGYPVALDAVEWYGGPHFNGHNDATFSHIMVVAGYNPTTDEVYFADPGATIWHNASRFFVYPSLKKFVLTYMQIEFENDGREHIGMYYGR